MPKNSDTEIAFEFTQVGSHLKVTAIDMVTGKEVSIVGDPKASEAELKRVALAKLLKNQ